jgi:NAD(P)H-nitrite reductase large subunit
MACIAHPAAEAASRPDPTPRAMTRCECAGVAFDEIARRLAAEGLSLDELGRRTGCARTCTACLPDLRAYLRSI